MLYRMDLLMFFRRLTVVLSTLVIGISGPAAANDELKRQLMGLGAAIILNEVNKSGQQRQKSQPSGSNSRATSNSTPRVSDAQRQAMSLQRNLNALGFDAGPVDGRPGARTRTAIQAYQVSRGFPATGSLSSMQMLALQTDVSQQASGGVETAESRRAAVYEAQSYLRELGYNPGNPDGAWGPRSQAALDAFRRDFGISSFNSPLGSADTAALYSRVHGNLPVARPGAARVASAQTMSTQAGPSFDCNLASTSTELAICAEPRLATLDRQLATAWNTATAAPGSRDALLPRHKAWLADRNRCGGNVGCLDVQMTSRIMELTGLPPTAGSATGFGAATTASAAGFTASTTQEGFAANATNGGFGATDTNRSVGVPSDADSWVHVENGRFIKAPPGFARSVSMWHVKHDPSVLENPDIVQAFYIADRVSKTGEALNTARATFFGQNALEQQDQLEAARQALLVEAQTTPEISPEAPVRIAFYTTAQPGEYIDGKGLKLQANNGQNFQGFSRDYPLSRLTASTLVPQTEYIPMSREAAKTFLDNHKAAQAEQKALVKVIWGTLTRFGTDESIAEFANPTTRDVPTTFIPDRATLHYHSANSRYQPDPITPQDAAVHVWSLDGKSEGPAASGNRDALSLARELGIAIEDGHVSLGVSLYGKQQVQEPWTKFNTLAYVGKYPDKPRQGDLFADVALFLLPAAAQQNFFGGQNLSHYAQVTALFQDGPQSNMGFEIARRAFPDPFAREDAKNAFFARYYEGILARTPQWPLPVLHKAQINIGEYDFDSQSFPLTGLRAGSVFRVASLPAAGAKGYGGFQLRSVEQIGNLPERLFLPRDQARRLTEMLGVNNPTLTLAWWADFDWTEDATVTEQLLSTGSINASGAGHAKLKRIGLFADPALTVPVLELKPEDVVLPLPKPAAPEATPEAPVVPVDLARLIELPRVDHLQALGTIARLLGGSEQDYERMARGQPTVERANEFDAPEEIAKLVSEFKAGADAPFWIEGSATLAKYDIDKGQFAFREGSGYVRYQIQGNTGRVRIQTNVTGVDPFDSLVVGEATAREIVEAGNERRIGFLMNATPVSVIDNNRGNSLNFELVMRPEEVIFYQVSNRGEPARILAVKTFAEENAVAEAQLSREFEQSEFSGLEDQRQTINPHILDLLVVRSLGAVPEGDALDAMLLAAWQAERENTNSIGPVFFSPDAPRPEGAERQLLHASFVSWMKAKAAALGAEFALALPRGNQNQQVCGQALEPGPIYGNTAVFQALPEAREDANTFAQQASQSTTAFDLPRRYGLIQRRPSARHDHCEQWFAFIVLSDAIYEGRNAGSAPKAVVEFTFDSVQRYDGSNPVADLIVRGTATATRLVAADGTIGAPVEVPAPEPEPEPAVSQDAGTSQAAQVSLATAAQAVTTPEPVAPTETLDWPVLSELAIAPSERDLLGLRTGQSIAEAEAIILERGGILAAFETQAPSIMEGVSKALAYKKIYVTRDGTEVLSLGSYAPNGPVIALMRRMVLPKGTLPYDKITEALEKKYGAPNVEGEMLGMKGVRGWIAEPSGDQAVMCLSLPYSHAQLNTWSRVAEVGDSAWEAPRSGQLPWQINLPDYPEEMMGFISGCKNAVVYVEETAQNWGASGFSLVMIDLDALQQVDLALSGTLDQEALEIDF